MNFFANMLNDPIIPTLLIFASILLAILIISFQSRARVFCQYLFFMSGIDLKPCEVKKIYKLRGKAGVRELFLDLIIREDLRDSPPITPDSLPTEPVTHLLDKD